MWRQNLSIGGQIGEIGVRGGVVLKAKGCLARGLVRQPACGGQPARAQGTNKALLL